MPPLAARAPIAFGRPLALPAAEENREVIYMERASITGAIIAVTEGNGTRSLLLGTMSQTEAAINASGQCALPLIEEWVQLSVLAALAWMPPACSALLVGLGGGVIVHALLQLSDARVHCIELEPEVLDVAQNHFGLRLDERCSVTIADAVTCLAEAEHEARYDVAIVDCFTGDGLAPCIAEGGLLPHLARCLSVGGLAILNLHAYHRAAGSEDRRGGKWDAADVPLERLCAHFDEVWALRARSSRNVIALCLRGACLSTGGRGAERPAHEWRRLVGAALPRAAEACPDVSLEHFIRQLEYVGGGRR